jgi:hypothetical protein
MKANAVRLRQGRGNQIEPRLGSIAHGGKGNKNRVEQQDEEARKKNP